MAEINISKVIADNGNAEGKLIISINVEKVSELENLFGCKKSEPLEAVLGEFQGKPLSDEDQLLQQTEAQDLLGVSRQWIYRQRRTGRLKAYKLGGRIVFYKKDLLALPEEC